VLSFVSRRWHKNSIFCTHRIKPRQTIFWNDARGLWISPEALPDAACGRFSAGLARKY
jgi:hypothetical protein